MIETFRHFFIKLKYKIKQNYLLLLVEVEAWSFKLGSEILFSFWFPLFCLLVVPGILTKLNVIENEKNWLVWNYMV